MPLLLSSHCFSVWVLVVDCQVSHLSAQKSVQEDLIDRLNTITERLNSLRVENDEVGYEEEESLNNLLQTLS